MDVRQNMDYEMVKVLHGAVLALPAHVGILVIKVQIADVGHLIGIGIGNRTSSLMTKLH